MDVRPRMERAADALQRGSGDGDLSSPAVQEADMRSRGTRRVGSGVIVLAAALVMGVMAADAPSMVHSPPCIQAVQWPECRQTFSL